jgi:hypothetical protein
MPPPDRPRRPRPAVEVLEERSLLSGLSFQFVIDDPSRQFAAFPLLGKDLSAVGQILSGLLGGQGTIQVRVRPNNGIAQSDGTTLGSRLIQSGGMAVCQNASLAEAQTGVDPNGTGPEAELDFNTQSYLPHAWFDPSGAARTGTVPAGRADFISVALHEMLHALAFQGYRVTDGAGYGTLPGGVESSFDALTGFGAGPLAGTLFFHGSLAEGVYGGPVPLTSVGPNNPLSSQNFYHLGNPSGRPGANLSGDIMNGLVFEYGTRYAVSKLDLAILADMGWAARGFPVPPAPTVVATPEPQPAAVPPAPNLPPTVARVRRHRHPRHAARRGPYRLRVVRRVHRKGRSPGRG